MKSFLDKVAFDLFRRTSGHMEQVTVIFPNKRASLFMDQSLSRLADRPVWAPRYTTISELFQSMTTLTVADPIMLNCQLYEVYHRVSGTSETFDHFYSWADVLISDFDDIDSNMVNATALFANVADIEAMTSFEFLTAEQIAAINQFFKAFNRGEKTELHERFLKMWNIMPTLYNEYRTTLQQQGLAYGGMLKRQVIEDYKADSLKDDTIYAVVGFNALSETERQLFLRLRNDHRALFYWDYEPDIDTQESGDCIRENIHLFNQALPLEETSERPTGSTIIASPTDNAQCRYVGKWLNQALTGGATYNRTAIVLCDESQLQPVLHSLPSVTTDGTSIEYNITMGYPMQDMPVSSFIIDMLTMQVKGWRDERTLYYRNVMQILQHPYVQMLAPDDVKAVIRHMQSHNIVYPHPEQFEACPPLAKIFTRKSGTTDILQHLKECLELMARCKRKADHNKKDASTSPLMAESIFAAWTMVNRLLTIAQSGKLPLQQGETLIRLMRHVISSRNIPFHGEPACGVQVMGVLETRNLDFDHIIMLSVGEGVMPRPSHQSSFIPYTLRSAYGMTTTEHNDGIYAYYFNRLRHRAHDITYIFNSSTEGLHKGEMSRFLIGMKLGGVEVRNLQPATTPPIREEESLKDGITSLKEVCGEDGRKRLSFSPSALNTYVVCPLQYYLKYVCGLQEQEEVSEEIDDALFGSIFHRAMELIYQPYKGRGDIQAMQIKAIHDDQAFIQKTVTQAFKDETRNEDTDFTGELLLNHEVITHFVLKQLELDQKLCPLSIIDVEERINLPFGGQAIIDREDIVTIEGERRHRIVDYKTSARQQTASSLDALFEQSDRRSGHIFQTLYYCEVKGKDQVISPALNYIKPFSPGDDMTIRIGKEPVTDYWAQCHDQFRESLDRLVAEIRSDENKFEPSPSKNCEYCIFAQLCSQQTVALPAE